MFWGVELVADRGAKVPFDPKLGLAGKLKKVAQAQGLLCYPMGGTRDGRMGDHILLAPPFIATEDQLDSLVDILGRSIETVLAGV